MPNNIQQSTNYFKEIAESLDLVKAIAKEKQRPTVFSTLKILEYWMRILSVNPDAFNACTAVRLMNEKYTSAFIKDFVALIESIPQMPSEMKVSLKGLGRSSLFQEADEGMDPNICSRHIVWEVQQYKKATKKKGNHADATAKLVKEVCGIDSNDMNSQLYQKFKEIAGKHFTKYAMEMLRKGISKKNESYKRVVNLKNCYHLSDSELELLLYLWLCESRDLCIEENYHRYLRHGRSRDDDNNVKSLANISRATGFSEDQVTAILGKDRTLSRLHLVDMDLDIPVEIGHYLSGISGDCDLQAFKEADSCKVDFEELQKKNPDANMALSLIEHHKGDKPLNILFYGMPGTGKTELSKAIAKKLNRTLWEVNIDADDAALFNRSNESRDNKLLNFRLRSIVLADWQCEKNPGIILVDEADLILNNAEKGSLNNLFENLRTPVIWISNHIRYLQDSTCRRFDFSIGFKPLAKDERLSILNSVLKTQHVEKMLTDLEKEKLVVEFPTMAGGYTLAVQHVQNLLDSGSFSKKNTYKLISQILKAHTQLMGIKRGSLKNVETHAPSYSLEGLNINGSITETVEIAQHFADLWKTLDEDSAPCSLNILLYGPPGTGKTEFVRYLARTLGRNLIIKRASDLLGMFVGQTEQNIAQAFEEAARTHSILFFDEADSMLEDRTGANVSWEVSKVNELLTQMENFRGLFVAATNFDNRLDPASSRRFALKVQFDYLKPEGVNYMWNIFFGDFSCPNSVKSLPMLAPGDFNAVHGRMRFLPASYLSAERIEAELRKELQRKDSKFGRHIGF